MTPTHSTHDHPPAAAPIDWRATVRVAALVSLVAALGASLAVRVGEFDERSVVIAVIVIVSTLAWGGVLDSTRAAAPVRVRTRRPAAPDTAARR